MNEKNSIFERSCNPGEEYNIDEVLAPADEMTSILLEDAPELEVSTKEIYSDAFEGETKKRLYGGIVRNSIFPNYSNGRINKNGHRRIFSASSSRTCPIPVEEEPKINNVSAVEKLAIIEEKPRFFGDLPKNEEEWKKLVKTRKSK